MPNEAKAEIPVGGSAVEGTGDEATFPIRPTHVDPTDIDLLTIRTRGKDLHISVNNGKGAKFDANLFPGWTFLIREKRASDETLQ